MRLLASLLTTTLLATPAFAAGPAPGDLALSFRDVAFGASPAEVEAALAPGLAPVTRAADALALAGTLDERAVQLHALFTPRTKRLWKVGVVYLQPLERPFDELERAWEREWARLAATFGAPTRHTAFFKTAVAKGGELAALKAGQAEFSAIWRLRDGYVACDLSRFGNLVVSYEHEALAALDSEERGASTRPAPEKKDQKQATAGPGGPSR